MIVKKGRFFYIFDEDNNEIFLDINNWKTPFGIEQFGKKTILNLIIPKNNNESNNLKSYCNSVSEWVKSEYNDFVKLPYRESGINELLRCELDGDDVINKDDEISGRISFRIYNFRGNWGISVIFKKK